jgi:hypothetical protein
MGWFHGIYTTARMLFGRKEGRKEGKGGLFFRIIMQMWILHYAWTAGNWRAHSLFDAL